MASPSRSPSPDDDHDFAHSTTALILVPDDDPEHDDLELQLDFTPEDDEDDDEFAAPSSAHTVLSSSAVFLYLVSPFLKLGALSIPLGATIGLEYSIPALVFFAAASLFTRQVWYLLARYTRKTSAEGVVLDAFARASGKRVQRSVLRALVRLVSSAANVLLAAIYLREARDAVASTYHAKPETHTPEILAGMAVLVLLCLCAARSLASRRVITATTASTLTFVAWLICAAVEHTRSPSSDAFRWLGRGSLWEPLAMIAFAFTSSSTLPLYASLSTATTYPSMKRNRIQSFTLLSVVSTALAASILLPLLIINRPRPSLVFSTESIQSAVSALNALTLVLGIPSLIVALPPLPLPVRLSAISQHRALVSHTIILLASSALALLPPVHIITILSDLALFLSLLGTFVLPSLLHITVHYFKRPIAIVVPSGHSYTSGSGSGMNGEDDGTTEMLLQRKEVALQRRRLWRRLLWDIGVWVLFLPIGGGGAAWAVGRLAGKW